MTETSLYEFWSALLNFIEGTKIFGPNSVVYAIDFEALANGLFPVGPPPFCLIRPGRFRSHDEEIGGGREEKTWTVDWTLAIVVRNYTDQPYQSTAAVTSSDPTIGIYYLADSCINLIEQGFIVDANANLLAVELPISGEISSPVRIKNANEYLYITIDFATVICESLPASLP